MGLSGEELKCELMIFETSINKLISYEEKIKKVQYENLKHPHKIPKNNLILEELKKDRDFYLMKVNNISSFLVKLNSEDIELIEMKYWYKLKTRDIAKKMYMSKSQVSRKLDEILEK